MSEEGAQPGRFPDPVMAPEGQEAAGRGAGLAAGGGVQGRAQARPAHPAFSTPESPIKTRYFLCTAIRKQQYLVVE